MNYLKKLFAGLFIILSLFFISPTTTHAQYIDLANAAKEYGLDLVGWTIPNMMIKKIVAQTVNWINSGFQGKPGYVQNPKQFFLDTADNEASRFLSTRGMRQICSPFKAEVQLALIKNYLQDGSGNYACSLKVLKNNYDQFMGDFSKGGWTGWFEMTQNDNSNPYGQYLNAQQQLAVNIGTQQNKYKDQLGQGNGFLSFEKCPDANVVTQAMIDANNALIAAGNLKPENNALDGLQAGGCIGDKVAVTPGTVLQSKIVNALGSDTNRLIQADELDELISALMNQLVNKIMGSIGLSGMSQSSNGQPSYTSQINDEVETPPVETYPGYQIPPCPADLGYPCDGATDTQNECPIPPTAIQTADNQAAIDYLVPALEAIPKMNPIVTPPPADYQAAVQAVVADAKSKFPTTGPLYYPGDNTVGLNYTYIVGPATIVASNQVGIGDTWRAVWRVTCAAGTGGTGGGPTGDPSCNASNSRPALTPTDNASLAQWVNASYKGWYGVDDTASDIAYWVDHANHYGMFSNGLCYIGWNAYWEARMAPGNDGSANPNLGGLLPNFRP